MKTFIRHEALEHTKDVLKRQQRNGKRVYVNEETGGVYPSVTSVTGMHNKQAIIEWRKRVGEEEANKISSRAAGRGTRVHDLCEQYLLGQPKEADIFDRHMFEDLKPHLDRIDNIHALESFLYSDHLQTAGAVDCIGEYDGKLAVIDFKTAAKAKKKEWIHNYFFQMSAYAVAFEELTGKPVSNLLVIMATDEDGVVTFTEKRDRWVSGFQQCRQMYKDEYGI